MREVARIAVLLSFTASKCTAWKQSEVSRQGRLYGNSVRRGSIVGNNNEIQHVASPASSITESISATEEPIQPQPNSFHIDLNKKEPQVEMEITNKPLGSTQAASSEWKRYRDRIPAAEDAIPLTPYPTAEPTPAPSLTPTSETLTSGPTSSPTESVMQDAVHNMTANADIESVEVELASNEISAMDGDTIRIFEQVCEESFLPLYLPQVYDANYTQISCAVLDQRMMNHSLDNRVLQQEQQLPQVANVHLESDTFSTLLQVLSTVDLPADQSFLDIVANTFVKYSGTFQKQLSKETTYFSPPAIDIAKPDGIKDEPQPTGSVDSTGISLAAKVGAGMGGFALAIALGVLFMFANRTRSRQRNKGDDSVVSCIVPNDGHSSKRIVDEEEETALETTVVDVDDTASKLFRRIMYQTDSMDKETEPEPIERESSKPKEITRPCSDVSSVTQATVESAHSTTSAASPQACLGTLLSQLDLSTAKSTKSTEAACREISKGIDTDDDKVPIPAGYAIPHSLELQVSTEDESGILDGGKTVTTDSMLSLDLYDSMVDSSSTPAHQVAKETEPTTLSSILGYFSWGSEDSGNLDSLEKNNEVLEAASIEDVEATLSRGVLP